MYYHNPVTVQKKDIVKLLQKTPALHILLKMDHRPKKTTPETPLGTPLVYVACPLRPTRLRLALFATTVLQRPAPRFRPSSLRSPQAPLWSLQTSQLESHELKPVDEYCTTPFCNGAFRGEIRYTGALSRVIYGTLAFRSV